MFLNARRGALFSSALMTALLFAPLLAPASFAAVGVRANAGPSQVVAVNDTVVFDGSRSYTLSGNNLTYTWDFNQADGIQVDATGVAASHIYNTTGIFTATLAVSDGAQSDTDTTTIIVTASNGTVPGVPNLPPVAVPPRNQLGFQNVSMVFDGTRSFDPNGDNLTYEWDFNELDGLTPGGDAQGAVVNWTYYKAGVYNVTLIVSDGTASDSGRTSAIILPDNGTLIPGVNIPPVAVARGDQFGDVNMTFNFNANLSFDLDGDTMHFTWDFDSRDGTTAVDAEGQVVSHRFRDPGIYNVTLTAADAQGQGTDTLRVVVTQGGVVPGVGNIPPIAIISSPLPGSRHDPGVAVHFNGTRSFDPDSTSGGNLRCQWDDASRSNGANVLVLSQSCDMNYVFAVNDSGIHEVALLVEDPGGAIGVNQVTFIVNGSGPLNQQPSCTLEGPATGTVGEVLNFTANCTDPESDPMNYTWDFDLSDGLGGAQATGRNVTWTYTAAGRYTVTVQVLDGAHRNVPVLAFLNLQIAAKALHAPLAFAGNDTTAQVGQGIVFDCTGNDTDGNITLFEWDFNGDGTYDYRNPDSGFTIYSYAAEGNYTAVCRVTDNDGLTGTDGRSVVITPAPNNAPTADAGPDKPNETQGLQTFFHGTGSDSDGAVALYEWDFQGDGLYDWSNSTSGDAFYTYPDAGTYQAVLRVTDNRGAKGTDTTNVNVKRNQPPVAEAGPDQDVAAGQQVAFSGAASHDAEGQITKYSWDFDSSDGIQEDFTGVAPVHTYTRGGSYLVTLTVYDALGQSDTDTLFVRVTQTGGVEISVDSEGSKEVAPDTTSSYLLTVKNAGDGTDTIKLTLGGDPDIVSWYTLETAQIANMEAGSVRIVRLNVAVPKTALVDDAQEIKVEASSVADSLKFADVSVYTTVKEVVRIDASFTSFPTSMRAGETIEVTLRVANTGNRDARVTFADFAGDNAWLTVRPPVLPPLTVKPYKSVNFTLDLTVPASASSGTHPISVTVKVAQTTVSDTVSSDLQVTGNSSFIPTLTAPALILGIVVAAAMLFRTRPARRT